MPADIVIYAIIAVGLVFWLRSLLGTRHGDERTRSNPYVPPASSDNKPKDVTAEGQVIEMQPLQTAEKAITDLAENPANGLSIRDSKAEEGLKEIARLDKSFEVRDFIRKSQDAFELIVEAYASGDRETLKDLLAENVFRAFEAGITLREANSETQDIEILAIDETDILEAHLDNKVAYVTLRFKAKQIFVARNDAGEIVGGHANKAVDMIDIWTLSRDLKNVNDPRWLLSETRSDDPEDNDIIPDTK